MVSYTCTWMLLQKTEKQALQFALFLTPLFQAQPATTPGEVNCHFIKILWVAGEQGTSESRQQPTYISSLLTCSCCLSIPLNIRWLMNLRLFGDLKTLMTWRLEVTVILHFLHSFHNLLKITPNIR